jgi:hypothetical protein
MRPSTDRLSECARAHVVEPKYTISEWRLAPWDIGLL